MASDEACPFCNCVGALGGVVDVGGGGCGLEDGGGVEANIGGWVEGRVGGGGGFGTL